MNRLLLKSFFVIALCTAALSSCKIAENKLPKGDALPSQFTAAADSSKSIASLSWKEYFQDALLLQLIDTVLKNNYDLKLAIQHIEIARANMRVAKGALLPSLAQVNSAGQRKFGKYTMDGVGNFDTNFSSNITEDQKIDEHLQDFYVGLQASWEIDLWGKLRNHRKAASLRLLSSEKGRQLVTTLIVAQTAHLYFELMALDKELTVVKENIELQQNALALIEIQKEAGKVTQLAVQQFKAQVLNTRGLEGSIRQRILEAENTIHLLMGKFNAPIQRTTLDLHPKVQSGFAMGLPSQMLFQRPDIQQAELELNATQAEVKAARASFYPSLNLSGAAAFNAFRLPLLFEPGSLAYSAAAGLVTPIFNRNQLKAGLRTSEAIRLQAWYQYQQNVISAYNEVVNAVNRFDNYREVAEFKESEVTELRKGVEIANELFLVGMADYLEVVTAQKNVLGAELDLAQARKEQYQSTIELYRSLGGGWQ